MQFARPSAASLAKLLYNVGKEEVAQDTMRTLQDLADCCDVFQRTQRAPKRFCVSVGSEDARINKRTYMDIMYIESRPVRHLVDEATHFLISSISSNVSIQSLWDAIVSCWSSVYTGLPNTIMTDQGS